MLFSVEQAFVGRDEIRAPHRLVIGIQVVYSVFDAGYGFNNQ